MIDRLMCLVLALSLAGCATKFIELDADKNVVSGICDVEFIDSTSEPGLIEVRTEDYVTKGETRPSIEQILKDESCKIEKTRTGESIVFEVTDFVCSARGGFDLTYSADIRGEIKFIDGKTVTLRSASTKTMRNPFWREGCASVANAAIVSLRAKIQTEVNKSRK